MMRKLSQDQKVEIARLYKSGQPTKAIAYKFGISEGYVSKIAFDLGEKIRPRNSLDYDAVYRFIVEFKVDNDGNSPSLQDILDGCNISSKSVAQYILLKLEEQGKIYLSGNGSARMIHIIGGRYIAP